ncbi:MAG TPA: tetratricopeptide repeat protein [Woeseiaceae bacterium]|nr:tetratricopeptide repeat protein [Woeseiaceae bacterium]
MALLRMHTTFRFLLLAGLASALCACATSPQQPRSTAHLEIQDAVGFTITEEARVSNDVRADYQHALSLLEQGRNAEGVALLESVAAAAPELSAPRIDLGIAYHQGGDLDRAEQSLQAALALNPAHPIAYNELGIVYRERGRFAEARKSYEAALQIYPGYHFARRNLAILCDLYLADLSCALDNYEAYLATVKSDEEASMWVADIRNRMNQ